MDQPSAKSCFGFLFRDKCHKWTKEHFTPQFQKRTAATRERRSEKEKEKKWLAGITSPEITRRASFRLQFFEVTNDWVHAVQLCFLVKGGSYNIFYALYPTPQASLGLQSIRSFFSFTEDVETVRRLRYLQIYQWTNCAEQEVPEHKSANQLGWHFCVRLPN